MRHHSPHQARHPGPAGPAPATDPRKPSPPSHGGIPCPAHHPAIHPEPLASSDPIHTTLHKELPMPQPHIRPDVVAFFADVNWHGHLDNPQRAYHRDGRPFTLAEQRLLVTITPEEKAAGHQQIRRENEWLDEVDPMRKRSTRSPSRPKPEHSGYTCRISTATGVTSTTGCGCGPSTAPESGFTSLMTHGTLMRSSTGRSRWTPSSCALTNMRTGHTKGGRSTNRRPCIGQEAHGNLQLRGPAQRCGRLNSTACH